jgi:polyisoprenoid-binding protein YceI
MIRNIFALLAVNLFFASCLFAADKYIVDKVHSTVGFTVTHLVISTVPGHFQDYDVVFMYDENDTSKSSVEATIKTASIFTDNQKRDEHLRSADFFDAEKYPEITFKSNNFRKTDDGYVVKGILTMRGVSKEVEIPFKILGKVKDPGGNNKLGIEGNLTINRQDYNVSWNKTLDTGGVVVSDDVKIELSIQFQKEA